MEPRIRTLVSLSLISLTSWPLAYASYTPFLVQSFSFNHTVPSQTVPIPVTTQCETIHLAWERSNEIGPEPIVPYFLQVYSSTSTSPFIVPTGPDSEFDWAVPFAPGTQYQICMFDSNGNSGGCEAMYTVIPSTDPTPPVCQNVTFPGSLDIQASTASGPLTQFGRVNQCTDITASPKNGTPPYTFTVAPALHPIYNISTKDMQDISWIVSLSQGFPFFISVADAVGNSWAEGPLYSGGGERTACLALGDVSSETWVGPSLAVGSGVGGLVLGSLIGIASAYMFMKHRRRKELRAAFIHMTSPPSPLATPSALLSPDSNSTQYMRVSSVILPGHTHDSSLASSNASSNNDGLILNRLTRGQTKYRVEPFTMPSEDGRVRTTSDQGNFSRDSSVPSARETNISTTDANSRQSQVVHHVYPSTDTTYHQRGGSESEALISSIDGGQISVAQQPLRGPRKPRKLSRSPRSPV